MFSIVFTSQAANDSISASTEYSLSVSREPAPSVVPPVLSSETSSDVSSSSESPLPVDETVTQLYGDAVEQNSDVKAWLQIPDTNINYPVLQAHDNNFYLDKGLNKSYYYWGSIFAHFRNNLTEADKLSRNTVLFGHNKNDGVLFGELMNFSDREYAQQHSYITLTVGETTTYWKIFSVMDCEVNNKVFYYINANPSDSDLAGIIEQSLDRSFWDYGLEVDESDRVLTLSTCTYKYTYSSGSSREDVRFVVMARQLREGEALDASLQLEINSDRRQPSF